MARFLIEVPHEATKKACEDAKQTFLRTGSHFITHADWGCLDDVHKAWMIVEMDSKEDVEQILPPNFRQKATIVTLERVDSENFDELASETHKN